MTATTHAGPLERTTAPAAAIWTEGLTKRFGRVTVVNGVSLLVGEGDRYGFLGPNGSGKTTTVRMLLGLVFPTAGRIRVLGEPVPGRAAAVLPQVGSLVEGPAAYGHLSARANLSLLDAAGPGGSRRTRRRRVDTALEQVGLAGVGRQPTRQFSLGMRQRLGVAAALVRPPRLLVLDEPGNGLDPHGMVELRELLRSLNAAGTTLFVSSHLLAEVEQLCTTVGVLDRGRLVLQDEIARLCAPTGRVLVRSPDVEAARRLLDGFVDDRSADCLFVRGLDAADLNRRLVGAGLRVSELRAEGRSLEEVVLAASGAGSDRVDRPGRRGAAR